MTLEAVATAAPRTVLTRDLGEMSEIDANPDGRAWARGGGSSSPRAFVLGPADEVRKLAEKSAGAMPLALVCLIGQNAAHWPKFRCIGALSAPPASS